MKNHIDITFDLETAATTPNAAVMQVAAVAWMRDAESCPFDLGPDCDVIFNGHVDLRTCVVDGFDFDQQTVAWWSRRSDAAKRAVTAGLPEPVNEVFADFINWINEVMKIMNAKSVCLWCQGMDFDAAILRNVCKKYDLQQPFPYQQFRDCRTIILEAAIAHSQVCGDSIATKQEEILLNPARAYDLFDPLPDEYANAREAHDALYDALRSSWNTWQALKWLCEFGRLTCSSIIANT